MKELDLVKPNLPCMARNNSHNENISTELPNVSFTWDVEAFSEAVRNSGVRLVHYAAQPCPVGQTDLNDARRPHPHHEGCSNGFLYTKVGCITALMTGNSKKKNQEDAGYADMSSVQCTFPATYDDSDDLFIVAPFDRFYLDEEKANVPMWQKFQVHETGVNRVKYPIECVQGPIVDSRNEKYYEGEDFTVKQGQIFWGSRRPSSELDLGPGMGNGFGTDRGAVCSIRYLYRPFWICGSIPHELRFAQVQTGFERKVVRAPQMAVLHREYVGQSTEQTDSAGPNTSEELRKVMAPLYGGFGSK